MNGQQLLGAQHAERLEDLRPDLVLAAVAARGGDEHRPHALPWLIIASSPLSSSSGCAVVCMNVPVEASLRSISRSDASSGSSPTGLTRSCAGSGTSAEQE